MSARRFARNESAPPDLEEAGDLQPQPRHPPFPHDLVERAPARDIDSDLDEKLHGGRRALPRMPCSSKARRNSSGPAANATFAVMPLPVRIDCQSDSTAPRTRSPRAINSARASSTVRAPSMSVVSSSPWRTRKLESAEANAASPRNRLVVSMGIPLFEGAQDRSQPAGGEEERDGQTDAPRRSMSVFFPDLIERFDAAFRDFGRFELRAQYQNNCGADEAQHRRHRKKNRRGKQKEQADSPRSVPSIPDAEDDDSDDRREYESNGCGCAKACLLAFRFRMLD